MSTLRRADNSLDDVFAFSCTLARRAIRAKVARFPSDRCHVATSPARSSWLLAGGCDTLAGDTGATARAHDEDSVERGAATFMTSPPTA
jgi:hypothetical protein